MKLWELDRTKGHMGLDIADGFVVRAVSSRAARKIAAAQHDDDSACWLDPKQSTCRALKAEGEAGVVLESFRAG